MTLRDRTVLVTGATGFIGGRLVEHLVRTHGANVRALVRNFANAPRLARFNVEMIPGDLRSADSVDRAVAGCDVVFHCAYGNGGDDTARRDVTVGGTQTLLDAALRHGVRRFVHTSTFTVYGDPPSGEIHEELARTRTGAIYGDTKIDAEALALSYCNKGLSVCAIQPTIVYGPYASTWTVKPLEQLATGRVILVNDGSGCCNAVYVDDVVDAMLRAAMLDGAHNHAFLISGDDTLTWKQFFERMGALVPGSRFVSMTADEATALAEAKEKKPTLLGESVRVLRKEIGRREAVVRSHLSHSAAGRLALKAAEAATLLPAAAKQTSRSESTEPPIHVLAPAKIRMFASTAHAKIDKAARLLGYRPAYDFGRGMAATEAWARWANVVA